MHFPIGYETKRSVSVVCFEVQTYLRYALGDTFNHHCQSKSVLHPLHMETFCSFLLLIEWLRQQFPRCLKIPNPYQEAIGNLSSNPVHTKDEGGDQQEKQLETKLCSANTRTDGFGRNLNSCMRNFPLRITGI